MNHLGVHSSGTATFLSSNQTRPKKRPSFYVANSTNSDMNETERDLNSSKFERPDRRAYENNRFPGEGQ